jgi:tetratricopeptide (TPR) repeat protein
LELVPQHRQLLELQGEIQHLLQAERHLAQARESVQKGDLDAGLREVSEGLKLVPQHAELHKLQDTIEQQIDIRERQRQAEQHLATAKDLEQEGKLNESLQEIEKGLAIAGEHPELLVLQNHVLAEQIRYQDADKLLQQAQRLNDDGRFEQAMQVVLEGLAQAPKHQALSELQQKLNVELAQQIDLDERQQRANQLFVRAQEQNREGDPGASLVTAQQGLKMLPQHTELQALSDQLLEQLMVLTEPELELAKSDVQAQSIQQVDQLLILAKQQFERRQLTRPADNNAFDNYQKVLQLDPDNNAAKAGLQSIAKLYLQWAQSNIRKGNLTKGLNNIDKGLGVLPQQKELQALRSEVIAKMSQHEQEQTVQPVPRQRITVDPCGINKGSKACWCKTFGMFCN